MCFDFSKSWAVYILGCSDDTFYCGSTNNIHKRLAAHNAGKGARYTRGRLPVKLLYLQVCNDKSTALKLEYKIKKLSRKNKIKLIKNEVAI